MTADVWDMLQATEDVLPPMAGGMLDQTKSYTDAKRFIAIERMRWGAEYGK